VELGELNAPEILKSVLFSVLSALSLLLSLNFLSGREDFSEINPQMSQIERIGRQAGNHGCLAFFICVHLRYLWMILFWLRPSAALCALRRNGLPSVLRGPAHGNRRFRNAKPLDAFGFFAYISRRKLILCFSARPAVRTTGVIHGLRPMDIGGRAEDDATP